MGRHRKDKKQLAFRMTYAEWALMKMLADRSGQTVTDYLVALLSDLYVYTRPEWAERKMIGIYVEADLKEAITDEAVFEEISIGELITRFVLKDFEKLQG